MKTAGREDYPYLVLNRKPNATGWLDPHKISAGYYGHKLGIGHSEPRFKHSKWDISNEFALTVT